MSYSYADKSVIEKLNFTIRKGDKILIKGPNGSGKSTFIKILLVFWMIIVGMFLLTVMRKRI